MSGEIAVMLLVIAARFVGPLFILRYPLPAIIACLILDGVDQTIFQSLGYDPPGYQGYDKAMDVFYLAVAYLAMVRNWTNDAAFAIGRFLYFYRLVGVLSFELVQWRPLLLIFPNTFEYFFIAYELVRLRWDPRQFGMRVWLIVAATIWVVVKLPQEWWIHIAGLDLTDTLAAHPALGWAAIATIGALAVAAGTVLVRRMPAPSWPTRVAADPLPEAVDTATERAAWVAANARVWSLPTLEKVILVGLLSVIFAQVVGGLTVGTARFFVGMAVVVVVNAAIVLWAARAVRTIESAAVAFAVRVVVNLALVGIFAWLTGGSAFEEGSAIFYLALLSLLTTLHDRFWPVREIRLDERAHPTGR